LIPAVALLNTSGARRRRANSAVAGRPERATGTCRRCVVAASSAARSRHRRLWAASPVRSTVADDPPCPSAPGDISAPRRRGQAPTRCWIRSRVLVRSAHGNDSAPRSIAGRLPDVCTPVRRAAGIWGSTAARSLRDHGAGREEHVTDRDGRGSVARSARAAGPEPDRCRLSPESPVLGQVTGPRLDVTRHPLGGHIV
jgi:hypothetical protein